MTSRLHTQLDILDIQNTLQKMDEEFDTHQFIAQYKRSYLEKYNSFVGGYKTIEAGNAQIGKFLSKYRSELGVKSLGRTTSTNMYGGKTGCEKWAKGESKSPIIVPITLHATRSLSLEYLKEYKQGGRYHDFLSYVKSEPELEFEIRMHNSVMIYCEKNLLLTVSHRNQKEDSIQMLSTQYLPDGYRLSNELKCPEDLKDIEKVKSYFSEAKSLCKGYKSHNEFIVQQWYKRAHSSFDDDILVIDMEWAPDQQHVHSSSRINVTNVDLIAVSNKPNEKGENDIFLVEVKCGLGACEGESGIQDHYEKSMEVINVDHTRHKLLADVESLILQKTELGLFSGTPVKYNFSKTPRIMFVLACTSKYDREHFSRRLEELKAEEGELIVEYPDVSSFIPLGPVKVGMHESAFKKDRRKHQTWFRENVLKLPAGKLPNWLSEQSGADLGNFVPCFKESIREAIKKRYGKILKYPALMCDMLSSRNIPWNVFVPMEEDRKAMAGLCSELIGRHDIADIVNVAIEQQSDSLRDYTAFDASIEYRTKDMKYGIIGIEVKYTEEGYSIRDSEFQRMQDFNSSYSTVTRESGCFINPDPLQFNYPDLIQIWRNHMLGIAMQIKGEINYFNSITLYPSGNLHFHSQGTHKGALDVYAQKLTAKGKSSFGYITFEDMIVLIRKYYKEEKFIEWIDYLETRYIK